ncbi:MAG: primosomal protein N' [Thermodesulfobacteriota bacterium]
MWSVAIPSPPYEALTYTAPSWMDPAALRPGLRVLAPLGRSLRIGVLLGRVDAGPEGVELKDLLWPAEVSPLLDPGALRLMAELSRRQMEPPGRILESLLPAGLRSSRLVFRVYDSRFPASLTPAALRALPPERLAELWAAWEEGRMAAAPKTQAGREAQALVLAADPPWAVRPGAARQTEILEYLFDRGRTPRRRLLADLGPSAATPLRSLLTRGLVRLAAADDGGEEDAAVGPLPPENGEGQGGSHAPTPAQAAALADLSAALERDRARPRLLFGVTGSGKTLVYLKLAEQALAAGRSALLLAPEVALAVNLARAARKFFPGREVRLFHGYQAPARREAAFRDLAAAKGPQLLVGARSALFLPLRDLGLVVLDEEHDGSFKQEERLPYSAKEVAWFRAREAGALLVLGSATPDLKTFHAADRGDLVRVEMPGRVGESRLPDVELVDIREHPADLGPFAARTAEALRATVAQGDQAVVLLNRRGYASLMYCRGCQAVAKCPDCDIGLTFHKARERLVCHYCGRAEPFPRVCPACGSASYLPMGQGTEQVAEALAAALPPGTGVLRLDRDSTRRPGRMEEILSDFAAGKARVLVGTQMLSKGHHFPDVTLVAVADGDIGLNLPDYRAAERTFQLLVQVSGRAGRGGKPGRVLIQTRNPGHYCWSFVQAGDYRGFYAAELEKRRRFQYPPFSRLGLVRISHPADLEDGRERVMALARILGPLGKEHQVRILGPSPAPLPMLRGRRRYQCLLKAPDWNGVRAVYAAVRDALAGPGDFRVGLDLDPVNML